MLAHQYFKFGDKEEMKKFSSLMVVALFSALMVVNAFAQPEVVIHHKVNEHSQSPNKVDAAATTGGTAAITPLVYHNGPLINQPTIYIIWYGNWNQTNGSDNAGGQQLIRDWANGIGSSAHFMLNSSLTTSSYPVSGRAVYGGETTDTGTSTKLRDSNIQSIVLNAISSGRLPRDSSGVYFVVTSSNVSETSGFCTQYCGWHTSTASSLNTNGRVRYSFIGNANRCLSSCAAQSVSPNGNAGIDGAISVMTHELEEATTDADPSSGWVASNGQENGDLCAWTFGHSQFQTANGAWANMTFGGHNWLIQRNVFKTATGQFCMVDSTHN